MPKDIMDDLSFLPDQPDSGLDDLSFLPDQPKSGFWQGLADVPYEMYNYVNELGKRGAQAIMGGHPEEAFLSTISPIMPVEEMTRAAARMNAGKPLVESPQGETNPGLFAASQGLGLLGFPTQGFQEAWQAGDYPRLAGQALGAAGTFYAGHRLNKALLPTEAAPPPPIEAGPFNQRPPAYQDVSLGGKPIVESPPMQGDMFSDIPPEQMGLPLGPYRGMQGRFTREGPGLPPRYGPEVGTGELQHAFDFGELSAPVGNQPSLFGPTPEPIQAPVDVSPMWAPRQKTPAPLSPMAAAVIQEQGQIGTPQVSKNQQVVTLPNPDPAQVAMLRNQGYVSVPGLRSPEGHVQMVRGDVAPLYVTGEKKLPPAPIVMPSVVVPEAINPGQLAAGDTVTIPRQVDQSFITEMAKDGYKVVQTTPNSTVFSRLGSESGMINLPDIQKAIRGEEPVEFQPQLDLYNEPHQPGDVNTGPPPPMIAEGVQPRNVVERPASEVLPEFRVAARKSLGKQISDFLNLGDDTPRGPIVDIIRDTTRRFLEDEKGTLNVDEIRAAIERLLNGGTITPEHAQALRRRLDNNNITEIDSAQTPERVRQLIDYWGNQVRTRTVEAERQVARDMFSRASRRMDEIVGAGVITPEEAVNPPSGFRDRDIQEISEASTIMEARELRSYWDDQVVTANQMGDQTNIDYSREMALRADERYEELRRSPNRPLPPTPVEGGDFEVFTYGDGNVVARFNSERDARRWISAQAEPTIYDYDNVNQFIESVEARHPETETQGVNTSRPANVETTGEATEVPNPPITFGKQVIEGKRAKVSKKAIGELETTADPYSMQLVRSRDKRPKNERTRNTWDDWADDQLAKTARREPGLYIENETPYGYLPGISKRYKISYHGSDGEPIAVAIVREDGRTGRRSVPTLAANRFKGLTTGRAVNAIGEALVKMNALRADGTISNYTANLIARLVKAINDDKGSFDIDQLLNSLHELKSRWLNKSPEIKSGSDVANIIEDTAGGKTSLRWLTGKAKEISEKSGWGMGEAVKKQKDELNFIKEALQLPSSLTTTMDLSAPGRQGLSMILTPQFWKAAGAMFKGLSAEGFNAIDADLKSKPLFQKRIDMETGTVGKSVAEEIGMRLFTPASRPGPRAEGIASRWLETGGSIPYLSAAYRNTLGAPIRMSNRAYITFLNHLNANRTEFLMNQARNMSIEALDKGAVRTGMAPWKTKFSPQEAMNLNPYHNLALGKEIADFVNTATGHGPLKTHLLPHKSAEISLESAASKLGYVLFSPGLLASRVRMLNPSTYIMATPFVRKQYVKAALSTFAAWGAFTQLAKMGGAEVGEDPTSADFGKVRIGDTRIDPGAGFLQYWVLMNRVYQGGYTSSATGEFHRFGEGFQAETQGSNAERFLSNKLNPAAKFAWDMAHASQYQPFHVKDRLAQLFVPLFMQDTIELAKENPELTPWLVPMMFGVGGQTYSKGESVGKLIDPENDWLATGGGIADLGPDYIHPRLDY